MENLPPSEPERIKESERSGHPGGLRRVNMLWGHLEAKEVFALFGFFFKA